MGSAHLETQRNRDAPGRIRTCDLRIRSPLLYPAELRAQIVTAGTKGTS